MIGVVQESEDLEDAEGVEPGKLNHQPALDQMLNQPCHSNTSEVSNTTTAASRFVQ